MPKDCGARRITMAIAFRTLAVTFGPLKKEEPRTGEGSGLLSLDMFELHGGVSGDRGCHSARADAPKAKSHSRTE